MRTSTCALLCLLLASLTPLNAQQPVVGDDGRSDVESKIISLEKRLWNGDVSKLEADDYEAIKHAHRYHRSDDEAAAKEAKFALVSMDDIRVSMLRPDVALMTYHATEKGSFRGIPVPAALYFGSIWVNRGGEWKNVFLEENLPDAFTDTYMPVASSVFGSQQTKTTEIQPPEPDSFFIEKEKEVWEALKQKDKAAATRLLADDFVGMYDFGFFNKKEWVKQIDDQYTVDDYTIMNPKVLHPSPNTALLLYTSTCKGTGAWADYCSNTSRIADLWVKRDEQWRALFSQDTTAASGDQDDASVMKEILASEYRIVGALSRDDIQGFADLLPEDVIDIDDDGIHTKAEWIPEMKEQKDKGFLFRDFRFDEPKLVRLGQDQATLTAKEIIHGLDKGKPFELRYYTNATYVRRNGKWAPRVYQDTAMVK
jgi:hypothetical protein